MSIIHYQLSIALQGPQTHATRGGDGCQEGCERGYYYLHRNLNNPLLHNCPLSIVNYQLLSLVLINLVIAAGSRSRVDHQRAGLGRHSEATGIDTAILSQFDARTVDGCGRHLTLCGRDAQLHLCILIEA